MTYINQIDLIRLSLSLPWWAVIARRRSFSGIAAC